MKELVEAMARGIAEQSGRSPDDASGGPCPLGPWLEEGEMWWTGFTEAAQAALAAYDAWLKAQGMMVVPVEPTQAMLEAFDEAMNYDYRGEPEKAYRAMLAASPRGGA